ncbi:MAG: hypothetical protein ACRDJ9_22670 [Dehalococcoidia bacterium]
MQDLYASSIIVNSAPYEQLVRDAVLWAWRGADGPPAEAWSMEHSEFHPAEGHQVTIERIAADQQQGTVVVWRHPDLQDPKLLWRATVEVSDSGGLLRLTIRIAREAIAQLLAPAALTLRPPRLVRDVLADYDCEVGGVRTNGRTRHLIAGQAQEIVSVLRDPTRSLPVLVAATNDTRDVVDDGQLAGLAHVIQLGRFGWEALRDQVGQGECFPFGGARLYWPPTSTHRARDRRYWRSDVSTDGLTDRLLRMLSSLSAARTPADRVIAELRRARIARIADLRAEVTDTEELLKLYEEENNQLKSTVTELGDELERLRSINEQLRVQLQFAGAASTGAESATDEEPPADWAEFARRVQSLEGSGFRVTDRARAMLAYNPYPDPARMWTHLAVLANAGAAYHDAEGTLGGRLKEWLLENNGIEISLHDGGLDDTAFEYDGQPLDNTPHVKVDDHKKSSECGRIYFALDKVNWRIVVDHIGLHR